MLNTFLYKVKNDDKRMLRSLAVSTLNSLPQLIEKSLSRTHMFTKKQFKKPKTLRSTIRRFLSLFYFALNQLSNKFFIIIFQSLKENANFYY